MKMSEKTKKKRENDKAENTEKKKEGKKQGRAEDRGKRGCLVSYPGRSIGGSIDRLGSAMAEPLSRFLCPPDASLKSRLSRPGLGICKIEMCWYRISLCGALPHLYNG